MALGGLAQPDGEPGGRGPQAVVGERVELTEGGEPGGDGHRVAGEGPRLVDVARGGDPLHQLPPAAVRGGRQATAEHLAHDRQVGAHVVELLGAARGDSEPGDHLVEDEQGARGVGLLAEELEEPGRRRNDAHVRRDRLDQDRGGVGLGKRRRDRVAIVPGHHDRLRRLGLGDARAGGKRVGRETRAGFGEQAIDVPVVGAGELEDPFAAGRGARQAHDAHRRLGAGVDHPRHLDPRHPRADLVGELDLALGRRPEAGARAGGGGDRLHDCGAGVAEDQRPPGADPVDVAVAVGIDQLEALAALDEDRVVAADRLHRPYRRVHAAGNQADRARVDRCRAAGVELAPLRGAHACSASQRA